MAIIAVVCSCRGAPPAGGEGIDGPAAAPAPGGAGEPAPAGGTTAGVEPAGDAALPARADAAAAGEAAGTGPAGDGERPDAAGGGGGIVSQAVFDATKSDIQRIIRDLNLIIRAKDYDRWVSHLTESYLTTLNSPEFLEKQSEALNIRNQALAQRLKQPAAVVRMQTARDYFVNVVVPSRTNDRVDDIEFLAEDRVRAYTVNGRGERLVLYNLEIADGEWKIAN